MADNTIKVLHIIPPGNGYFGGIEAFLCGYYKNMNRSKFHFDFSFCGLNTMKIKMSSQLLKDSKFIEYNVLTSNKNKVYNWILLIQKIRENLRAEQYDVVEIHTGSPMIQAVCGLSMIGMHVEIKIAHSHARILLTNRLLPKIIGRICTKIIQVTYDKFFACSKEAGGIFGKRIVDSERFIIIKNAIQMDDFKFDENIRKHIRNQYEIAEDTIVVGHVARLAEVKNQVFLIDVFKAFHDKNSNSVLWIVGEGKCRSGIEKKVLEYGLNNDVVLFGKRNDVNELLQAMDVFIMTSIAEGLCISAIESQAAGLPTIVSTGIPEECRITDLLIRIPLERGALAWADEVGKMASLKNNRDYYEQIKSSGYDLKTAAAFLENQYNNIQKDLV